MFASRRVRALATISVSVVVESPKPVTRYEVEHHRIPEAEDRPELRTRWRALPTSIRPEDWVTETGVKQVPGSLLIAEEQRRPEGYYPGA